jgi:hypothetical protein
MEYLGHTVNFKTQKPSFKSKKYIVNPKEDRLIFENTHEPITDDETFSIVQKLRETKRCHNTFDEVNPLTGLLFCGECGAKLYNNRKRGYMRVKLGREEYQPPTDEYRCSNYTQGRNAFEDNCTIHHIRTEVANTLILSAIQRTTAYVRENEAEFAAKIKELSTLKQSETAKSHTKQITKHAKRIAELNALFRKTYEDNATGKLSDAWFEDLTGNYEREKRELTERNTVLQAELDAYNADAERVDNFIALVRKYTEITELTPQILNEFVSRVIVHEADNSSGERVQDVEIYLNYVGRFEVPVEEPSPEELEAKQKLLARRLKNRENARLAYHRKKAEYLAALDLDAPQVVSYKITDTEHVNSSLHLEGKYF